MTIIDLWPTNCRLNVALSTKEKKWDDVIVQLVRVLYFEMCLGFLVEWKSLVQWESLVQFLVEWEFIKRMGSHFPPVLDISTC